MLDPLRPRRRARSRLRRFLWHPVTVLLIAWVAAEGAVILLAVALIGAAALIDGLKEFARM